VPARKAGVFQAIFAGTPTVLHVSLHGESEVFFSRSKK
jgi:hypothetical protein